MPVHAGQRGGGSQVFTKVPRPGKDKIGALLGELGREKRLGGEGG